MNELVSNSLKHAFPTGRQPVGQGDEIRIELGIMADQQVRLLVADNGIGLPEKIDLNSVNSLGLQLVHLLTRHMDGTIAIDRWGGTTFAIEWPFREE